jgi:hypothetical protein
MDRKGTDYGNLNFAFKGTGLPLPEDKAELIKRVDSLILARWVSLKEVTNPDVRLALKITQIKFSQLRADDQGLHARWKILRDARSKYSTNIWRDINSIPDRLDRFFTLASSGEELDKGRMRQKLRMISHEMDQAGNVRLFRAIDLLVSQT